MGILFNIFIFNYIFILVFCIDSDIIINPIKITNAPNALIIINNAKYTKYFSLISSDKLLNIDKETGDIKYIKDSSISYIYFFWTYNSNYFIYTKDNSNKNKYYSIEFYSNGGLSLKDGKKIDSDIQIFGYISNYSEIYQDNILYGKKGNNLYFYSLNNDNKYEYYVGNINGNSSCILLASSEYICAFPIKNKNITINIYKLLIISLHIKANKESYFNNHINPILYYISNYKIKICAENNANKKIECCILVIDNSGVIYGIDINCNNIQNYGISSSLLAENCFCDDSDYEYLCCCGNVNNISCKRINKYNSDLINEFILDIPGQNTNLTIRRDENYTNIFYFNNNYLYKYIIYFPQCQNISDTLIIYHQSNINTKKFNNYFDIKTNTQYYLEFDNLPYEYGDSSLNGTLLNDSFGKFEIYYNEDYIFDFISLNDNVTNEHKIYYNFSINETYSKKCEISLTIFPCYKSCSKCSKSNLDSNKTHHNCLENECKPEHYPSPINSHNCFNISEKYSNWYFNYTELYFGLCNQECKTCTGPNNNDCETCYPYYENKNNAFYYEGKCLAQCPEGTYGNIISPYNYYECLLCYKNCKTCSQGLIDTYMNCDTCLDNDNYIKNNTNCYKEYDTNTKTFYDPLNNNEITSCYELFGFYIKENTYECIESKEQMGYFLSNNKTGLLSKCHSDCKICNKNYSDINTNCDECINGDLFLQEGNCVDNCSVGYYSINKKCFKCHDNCLLCNEGPIYMEGKLVDMKCLECKNNIIKNNDSYNIFSEELMIKSEGNCFPIITYTEETIIFNISEISSQIIEGNCLLFNKSIKYGEYQCKDKPYNTFYVNINENTGIIKDCHESCDLCKGENTTEDTNCINCIEGYYKTEDSYTNCILESLIPINYYKNLSDNIYYKCHQNCYNCTEKYNEELNEMHCIECSLDYYFLIGTNNCYNMSLIENEEYYFYENIFYNCYNTCSKCLNLLPDINNHYCVECISEFFFLENTTNCYDNITMINNGYYLDYNNNITLPMFKKCYENCKTCNNYFFNNDMNCILCRDDYFKINGTNNCYNMSLINSGFYFYNNLFFPCHENCLTCSGGVLINNNGTILSHNCDTCDKIKKGLYLVEDLNNCENINYTINGYYLDKSDNNIDILKKCYKSCKLCENGIIFDNETNQFNHNCKECQDNYYRMKNDLNKDNCYGDEMLELNYTLENNLWKICHENCFRCNGRPIYNNTYENYTEDNNNLISQNCITCIEGYNLIFKTNDCYNDTIISEGYYLSQSDSMYHKCDIQCQICEKEKNKCLICNTEKGYYIAEDKPIYYCYNNNSINSNNNGMKYSLVENNDNESKNISDKKWIKCYSSCNTCFDSGNDINHNCISCVAKYYFIYNTTNCINKTSATEKGYYLNYTIKQFTKCYKACINCSSGYENNETNCYSCNTKQNYYPVYGKSSNCYNSEMVPENYFLDYMETPYKWKKCHDKCSKCTYQGNDYDMKCLSCKENYFDINYNKTMFLKLSKGNCIETCNNNLFMTKYGDCVENCPNNTYKFIPNSSCVDSCPLYFELNKQKTQCIEKQYDETLTPDDLKKQLLSNMSYFLESPNVINGSDFIAIITTDDNMDPEESIKKGITAIDLGDCVDEIKEYYNIPKEESLVILEMESKDEGSKNKDDDSFNLGKNVQLEIYDMSGQKLDISVCKADIKLMKYIGDAEELDIQSAMEFSEQGIDVFNAQDDFFNDICHPFNSKNGADIVLSDRREDIYQNASFCQEGCVYNGMNYKLMTADCLCNASSIQGGSEVTSEEENNEKNEKLSLSNLATTFTESLLDFNYVVIKCYNLVFDAEILKQNIGFFSMFSMLGIQIIFLVLYLIKRLKPIRNYMMIFEPFDPKIDPLYPPPKNKGLISELFKMIKEKNNDNENKKEREIKKSILINNLLQNSKAKIKNQKKDKNNEDNNNNNDMIIIDFVDDEENPKRIRKIHFKENNKIDFSRNKQEENSTIKRNTTIKKSGKEKDLNKKKLPIFSTYETNSKNNDYNFNKINGKQNKKTQIKFSDVFSSNREQMSDTTKINNIVSNSERENIQNSEAVLKEKNIENIYNTKKNKLKSLNSRIKLKSEKIKISNKQKENINKETDGENDINIDNKINKGINRYKYKNKVVNFALTDDDYQDLDYDKALILDKRSCLRMYWAFLVNTQIILGTFFTSNFLHLFVVKLSFLVSNFQISFFLNALFYSDDYISDAYHNNGVLDFFSGLPKSIYSFIATLITTSLLGMLNNSKNELMDTIKERDNKKDYIEKVNHNLKKLRNKLIAYYFFLFLLGIFFLYYVSAFCAVYRNSQRYWLIGCFESFAIDTLVAIGICILLSIFRYIAIKKRIKCFYKFANLISSFM